MFLRGEYSSSGDPDNARIPFRISWFIAMLELSMTEETFIDFLKLGMFTPSIYEDMKSAVVEEMAILPEYKDAQVLSIDPVEGENDIVMVHFRLNSKRG